MIESDPLKTAKGEKAVALVAALKAGKSVTAAEKEAGITIKQLRAEEEISASLRKAIKEHNLDNEWGIAAVRSRLFQILAGQDDKVAVTAAKELKDILKMAPKEPTGGGQFGDLTGPVQIIIAGPETKELVERTKAYQRPKESSNEG